MACWGLLPTGTLDLLPQHSQALSLLCYHVHFHPTDGLGWIEARLAGPDSQWAGREAHLPKEAVPASFLTELPAPPAGVTHWLRSMRCWATMGHVSIWGRKQEPDQELLPLISLQIAPV